jgi:hypothetical protein
VVFLNYYYFSNYLLRFDDTYINIHSYDIHSSRQSDITFIHERFLIITEVGKVFIHRKNVTRYSDIADMVLHVVIIRRVSILFKVAFYTVMIRYDMQVSVALSAEHLPLGCGSLPIGGSVRGARRAGGDGGAGWATGDAMGRVSCVSVDSEEDGSGGLQVGEVREVVAAEKGVSAAKEMAK